VKLSYSLHHTPTVKQLTEADANLWLWDRPMSRCNLF